MIPVSLGLIVCITLLQAPSTQFVGADIAGIVKAGTPIELVKDGLASSDDPIGLPDGTLLFTEPAANRVSRIGLDGRISTFIENTNAGLGLSFDSKGRLFQAQSAEQRRQIAIIYPRGKEKMIADTYEGRPFNRPNDIIVDKKGGVYFTDPGLSGTQRDDLQKSLGGKALAPRLAPAVYYVPPEGRPIKVAEGIERPNGITLSRDEKTLYVNNTNGINLIAFDVESDGTLSHRRNLAVYEGRSEVPNGIPGTMTGADGLTIDSNGRLYAITSAGVEIFSPGGQKLGTIRMTCAGKDCQGLAFAGPDKKTLYIAGRGSIWKIQMQAQGFAGRPK